MLHPVGLFAVAIIVTTCAFETTATGEGQLETFYMFACSGGAIAYSIDQLGANLLEKYAPWRPRSEFSTNGPAFIAGIDKTALEEVKTQEFLVMVLTVTTEDATGKSNDRSPTGCFR